MIRKDIADKIASQALEEIAFSRIHKQTKVGNWSLNEQTYYGQKLKVDDQVANVALGQMQEFVHTLLSKIDNPLVFKYTKRKNSQLKRVQYLNALRESDADEGFWDLKDIVGKKQVIIYGRAVYAYSASSNNGYQSKLEPVDVYDFLIDPSADGIDIETAMNMGRWGIVKTSKQLKDGVKDKIYHAGQVKDAIASGSDADTNNQEETNKKNRSYSTNTKTGKEVSESGKWKFWEWVTTYDGERYYILMDNSGNWIRCELLKDMFTSNLWPFWTYAAFPDLTEFWTPSYCDYVREVLFAQEASINQMLTNGEKINNPQKLVRVEDLEDISKVLKYKKNGLIPVKKNVSIDQAIQFVQTPSINTPIQVFEILQGIKDRTSGVGANEAGVADEKGRVGIYEGNQVAAADRFGLLNKSYSFGYKRFSKLYEWGIKDHLNQKKAIDILGPSGVEIKNVNKRDIYKRGDEFGCLVEASDAEVTNSIKNQSSKLQFLAMQAGNPLINATKSFELQAKIAGLTGDEVRELLDVENFGNEELMAEADRDIEALLNGEIIEPNEQANVAYKQKMVNYLREHKEDIKFKQFELISLYIESLEPTIMRNEARKFQQEQIDLMNQPLNPEELENQEQGQIQNYDLQN